jgi:PTS system nitrogen regulatory IIA component
MELTLVQVARLFNVTENTVTRWVQQENLPAYEINSQVRFDRAELLEWAALRKRAFDPSILQKMNGDRVAQVNLAAAIERGGVAPRISAGNREEVYRAAVDGMPLPEGFDREGLLQLFLVRERLGGTAIGEGLAVPHPRCPIVLPGQAAMVYVCFLDQPLDFNAADGQPVDTLFFAICPTVHDHLQLLARLAAVLRCDAFRRVLATRPDHERLVAAARAAEESFGKK